MNCSYSLGLSSSRLGRLSISEMTSTGSMTRGSGMQYSMADPRVIDPVDVAWVGHAVRHDRLDGDQLLRMRRDVGEEVPADAVDWLELGLIQDQRRELLPGGAQRDEVRLDLLAGEGIDGMDAAVEYNRADHVLLSGVEDLAERPQSDLGDDTLIDLPDLRHRSGYGLDHFAGLDMPERFLHRDDLDRRQIPLHSKQ